LNPGQGIFSEPPCGFSFLPFPEMLPVLQSSSMQQSKLHLAGDQISVSGMVCPFCGDSKISFNSRSMIPIRGTVEWVGIFCCSDAHIFFVPLKSMPGWDAVQERGRKRSVAELRSALQRSINRLRRTAKQTEDYLHTSERFRAKTSAIGCMRRGTSENPPGGWIQ